MWVKLLILAVLASSIVLLSLSLYKLNTSSGGSKSATSAYSGKLCGDKYVEKQNECLKGRPWITDGCFKINHWSDKAQKCMDNTIQEAKDAGCRKEDWPVRRVAYRFHGCG